MALEVWRTLAIYLWIKHMYDATRTWESINHMLRRLFLTIQRITCVEDRAMPESESCRSHSPRQRNQSPLLAPDAHPVVASNKDGKMGQNHPCFPEYFGMYKETRAPPSPCMLYVLIGHPIPTKTPTSSPSHPLQPQPLHLPPSLPSHSCTTVTVLAHCPVPPTAPGYPFLST